jgi:hypothetical protein
MNTLKFLTSSTFVIIILSTLQLIHGAEELEQKDPPGTSRKAQAESQDAPPPYREPEQVQASAESPSRGTDLSLPFSADECYAFALMHHYGNGVPQNYVQAREWYKKAAAQGNADAQNAIEELEAKEVVKQPNKELPHKKEPLGEAVLKGGNHYKGVLAGAVIGLLVGGNWKEVISNITRILPDASSFLQPPTHIDHCGWFTSIWHWTACAELKGAPPVNDRWFFQPPTHVDHCKGFTSMWHWTACAALNGKAMPAVLPRDDRWFLQPPTYIDHCGGFTSVWHWTVCNELKEAEKLRIERLKEAEKQRVESLQKEMATREKRFVSGLKAYDIMESPLTTTDEMIEIMKEVVDFINQVPLPSPSKDSEFSEEKQMLRIKKARESVLLAAQFDGHILYDLRLYDTKVQAQRDNSWFRDGLAVVVDFIKKDLMETMELHQALYGVPHHSWDEFNRKR